jgi:L-fuculose-phosphate aldolase
MDEWKLRELICEVGRRAWERGLVAASDGNISCRLDASRVLATPTGMSKGLLTPEILAIVDLDGNQLAGPRRVTSELKMHLKCYRERSDIMACVHAHPPHATAFAIVQQPVPKCVMPEAEVFLGEIPIVPYATPGTQEFAEVLVPYLPDFDVFLLANHGALSVGKDLLDAYHRMETVDHYCRILINVKALGGPTPISPEAMEALFETKRQLGIRDRRLQPGGTTSCDAPSPTPREMTAEGQPPACECQSGEARIPESDLNRMVEEVIAALRGAH